MEGGCSTGRRRESDVIACMSVLSRTSHSPLGLVPRVAVIGRMQTSAATDGRTFSKDWMARDHRTVMRSAEAYLFVDLLKFNCVLFCFVLFCFGIHSSSLARLRSLGSFVRGYECDVV